MFFESMFLLAFLLPSLGWCLPTSPMESTDKYQGDIVLSPDAMKAAKQKHLKLPQFGGEPPATFGSVTYGRWPNGVVPYVISDGLKYQSRAVSAIKAAMNDYHQATCIRFKQRTNERQYIYFQNGGGCSSPVGMQSSGANVVTLASGCWSKGTIAHEVGHSLGFFHEQSRQDRDKHVTINWQNIVSGMGFNFNKQDYIDSLGTDYDLGSMMHYSSTAFSTNGYKTIVTKDVSKQHIIDTYNRISGFSQTDINQLNKMYPCNNKPTVVPTSGPTGPSTMAPTQDPSCKNKHSKCGTFANAGYCTLNQSGWEKWMKDNCCEACSSSCRDENTSCQMWANRGECKKNPSYMLNNCKKACKVC